MPTPIPLPSKYFIKGLETGYIITGRQMADVQLPLRTQRLARLGLIDEIKDRFFLSEKAGFGAYQECIKI